MKNNVFERKETKYILSKEQLPEFLADLSCYMEQDEHGLHLIQSLYYDTSCYQMIRHSMEKPNYKEKFRVRCYGVVNQDAIVFLELKKKIQRVVYKRRMAIPYSIYQQWILGGKLPENPKNPQIQREIAWLFRQYPDLAPKVLISYERLSYFGKEDSAFRITFDQRISYEDTTLDLADTSSRQLVAPELGVLMEVKALGAYPLWFVTLLNQYQLKKSSFSKYAQTYQRHLWNKGEKENVSKCVS